MTIDELHPLARELISAYSSHTYFHSVHFCRAVAAVSEAECVAWATRLIEPAIGRSTPHPIVVETLDLVKALNASPLMDTLPNLDAMAWQCWCSGSFDDDLPYLQRAVSRLSWATIGLTCLANSSAFKSEYVDVSATADDDSALSLMIQQSATAIDMTLTASNDGRLAVGVDFTRVMERLS